MSTHDQHLEHHPSPEVLPQTTQAEPQTATGPAQDEWSTESDRDADAGGHAEVTGVELTETPPGPPPQPSPDQRDASDPAPTGPRPAATSGSSGAVAKPSSEASLFAENELAGLRARWDNVQAGFVDDPRDCVQKADGLVCDVVVQLTSGFTEARTRLEDQWGRGEEASTEDLRVALTRYRDFFERLLAV